MNTPKLITLKKIPNLATVKGCRDFGHIKSSERSPPV